MILISVYGELPLPTYLQRLIFTFSAAELVHIPSLLIASGGKIGSQLIASELAFVLDVFDNCKGSFELHSSNS